MNPFLKWIFVIGSIIFLIITIYIIIPTYPQPFFDYKLEHKKFTIYSDEKIPDNFIIIIDDVIKRLKSIEINDSDFQPSIFICNNEKLYSFFAFWAN